MNEVADLRAATGVSTHQGLVRDHNEDSWFVADGQGVWAVADGMGGHERGEWASGLVVEELRATTLPDDFDQCCEALAEALHTSNRLIFEDALKHDSRMGTTAVVLLVRERRFAVLWAGDSRAYLLRDGALHQLSRDHTQVQEMVDRGLLEGSDAQVHPMRHVLARAIGVEQELQVDVIVDEVQPGDTFLISSDGLHSCVPDTDIRQILAGAALEQIASRLVDETLARGAPDNVTVIAVRFRETTLLTPARQEMER